MGPAVVVAELVEHGVEHLLVGDEVVVAAGAAQPQLDLDPRADVEAQQIGFPRRELGEDLDAPLVAAHDGLDLLGDAVEERAGGRRVGLGLERADLPHFVQVAHLHRRRRLHAGAARFEMGWGGRRASGRRGAVDARGKLQ